MKAKHQPHELQVTSAPWPLALRLALIFLGSVAAWACVVFFLIVMVSVIHG